MTQRQPPARSILWVGPGREVPARLLRDLHERGLEPSVARSAPALVVELSLAHAQAGGEDPPVQGVVLVEPDRLPRAAELVAVLKDYFPQVQRWRYETGPDGKGELAALNGRFSSPAGPADAPPRPAYLAPDADDHDVPLVSREELALLLGNEEEPSTHQGARARRDDEVSGLPGAGLPGAGGGGR